VTGANGLPAGVKAHWAADVITISGTPTASGVFAYTIPLTGGCGTVNATGTITVTADMTAGVASSTPTLCINTALTNITHATTLATGIGAPVNLPAGVTAAWLADVITISGTPTASGTFNYSIPLTGGCGSVNATGTITVNPNLPAGISIISDANNVCAGTTILFTATPTNGGTAPTYQWKLNGLNVGTNGTTYSNSTLVNGAVVTCEMISNATCAIGNPATSNTILVTVSTPPTDPIVTPRQPTCSVATGAITITSPKSAGITYSIDGLKYTNTSGVFNLLAPGNYNVTAKNSNGCISVATLVTINVQPATPDAPNVVSIIQPNFAIPSGSVVLNNLPSGNWTIMPGKITGTTTSATLTGLAQGIYAITVQNADGCISAPISVTIFEVPVIIVDPKPVQTTCQFEPTTPLVASYSGINGIPSYQWFSNTSKSTVSGTKLVGETSDTFNPPSSLGGTFYYYCEITLGNSIGLSNISTLIVKSIQAIVPKVKVNDATCKAINSGSIQPTIASNPHTTLWTGPNGFTATTDNISNLSIGTYNLTVTSADGCVFKNSYTIDEPDEIAISTILRKDISLFGASDGEIAIAVNGGTPPYTLAWSLDDDKYGTNLQALTKLGPGEYKVTVTDIYKCKADTATYIILEPTNMKINTFSPNGDDVNEVFMKGFELKIFNRNGILLFEGSDGWDGTYKGVVVATDTYFYQLKTKAGEKNKYQLGYVKVVREQ